MRNFVLSNLGIGRHSAPILGQAIIKNDILIIPEAFSLMNCLLLLPPFHKDALIFCFPCSSSHSNLLHMLQNRCFHLRNRQPSIGIVYHTVVSTHSKLNHLLPSATQVKPSRCHSFRTTLR